MNTRTTNYAELATQLEALLAGETDPIANAANLCALLHAAQRDTSWTGFYFRRGEELVLGPFQGPVACVRIPIGRGVCGTAAAARESQLVADVHEFEGHIACDAGSRAELVVPLIDGDTLRGVIDIDSYSTGRFDSADREGVELLARIYVAACEF